MPPLKSISFQTARNRGACYEGRTAVARCMGYENVTEAERDNARATARDLINAVSQEWTGLTIGTAIAGIKRRAHKALDEWETQ